LGEVANTSELSSLSARVRTLADELFYLSVRFDLEKYQRKLDFSKNCCTDSEAGKNRGW